MSEVLASAEDQQITECEEYALCHGEVTRKKSYTSQKVKKSMASMGTDWYQKAFAPGEARLVMADEKKKKLAERAQERQCKQLREQEQDRLKKLCAAEVASAEDFQALQRSDGKDKVFSNLTRIGLLSAIREASESEADSPQVAERVKAKVVPGKPGGIAAALLLSGSGLVNKHNAQLMVRLVTALPPGSFGRIYVESSRSLGQEPTDPDCQRGATEVGLPNVGKSEEVVYGPTSRLTQPLPLVWKHHGDAGQQQLLPGKPLHCQAAPPLGAQGGQTQRLASTNRDAGQGGEG